MSIGLLALLDDVAGIAKVAAASLDDVAGQAAKAGVKAAGAVIDDAAVTPRYVDGFAAERELPIVWKIALGSLRNKLLILLPVALALSAFMPGLITPLLMLGGAYLCYEGAEKIYGALFPHEAHAHEDATGSVNPTAASLEEAKVAGAIKTDFILSAEIMTIALSAIPQGSFWMEAAVLALVGTGITIAVYGGVALIVKADDAGLYLARNGVGPLTRGFGRFLVKAMPRFMTLLGIAGTAAMIWVGGGILLHGLESFGLGGAAHALEHWAQVAASALPSASAFVEWAVFAFGSGIAGLLVGALLIPVAGYVVGPLLARFGR
ncbi:DUF808 domain-containing protein [Rhizobiaceae bacterium BDR2-2]|uniref:DUF808 domain-containing protein n=1 Tax=Ectorhizobium quercum TaxID=2965071 RepID=A0AAE3MYP4_9HYPH|nr:DUF808 domain-containing protein [Ectorhizobium quercum]MCX8996751.1 DUF808 domain-containing protein [Ectorhizobium quercum]